MEIAPYGVVPVALERWHPASSDVAAAPSEGATPDLEMDHQNGAVRIADYCPLQRQATRWARFDYAYWQAGREVRHPVQGEFFAPCTSPRGIAALCFSVVHDAQVLHPANNVK